MWPLSRREWLTIILCLEQCFSTRGYLSPMGHLAKTFFASQLGVEGVQLPFSGWHLGMLPNDLQCTMQSHHPSKGNKTRWGKVIWPEISIVQRTTSRDTVRNILELFYCNHGNPLVSLSFLPKATSSKSSTHYLNFNNKTAHPCWRECYPKHFHTLFISSQQFNEE